MTDAGPLGNFSGIYKICLCTGCLEWKGKALITVSSSPFQEWPHGINCWVPSKLHQCESRAAFKISMWLHKRIPKTALSLGEVLPDFVCKVCVKPVSLSVAGEKCIAKGFWNGPKRKFDTSTYPTLKICLLNRKIVYNTITYVLMHLFHVIHIFWWRHMT